MNETIRRLLMMAVEGITALCRRALIQRARFYAGVAAHRAAVIALWYVGLIVVLVAGFLMINAGVLMLCLTEARALGGWLLGLGGAYTLVASIVAWRCFGRLEPWLRLVGADPRDAPPPR